MTSLNLIIEMGAVAGLTGTVLYQYGDWWRQHAFVTAVTFISWYLSFLIVFLLPNDVTMTLYRQCLLDHNNSLSEALNSSSSSCRLPWIGVASHIMPSLWRVIYWSSQMLTWILLPLMQSYAKAGEFSVGGKLRAALIDNALYYGTYLLVFGVCFVYIATRPDVHLDAGQLKVIGITAANTWGLVLIVFFLGYGLVELPRSVWLSGKPTLQLRKALFRAAQRHQERVEAQEELEDALEEVRRLGGMSGSHCDYQVIVKTCGSRLEQDPTDRHKKRNRLSLAPEVGEVEEEDGVRKSRCNGAGSSTTLPDRRTLVRLHCRIKRALVADERASVQWKRAVREALLAEDLETNRSSRVREYRHGFPDSFPTRPFCCCCSDPQLQSDTAAGVSLLYLWKLSPCMEWYWKCFLKPTLLQASGVLLCLLSALLVWSEATFFVERPVLSVFARLVTLAAHQYHYILLEFVCLFCVGYLCLCTYFTVFRLRIFNYFRLVPGHLTDENSLVFSGMLLCRLTPPMAMNFLGLIHLDSHVTGQKGRLETAYTTIMGHLDLIRIVTSGFNIYFPMLLILLCTATYLRLGTRLLNALGVQQFMADEMTEELVEEGRTLIKRERHILLRKHNREKWIDNVERASGGGAAAAGLDAKYSALAQNSDDSNTFQLRSTTKHSTNLSTFGRSDRGAIQYSAIQQDDRRRLLGSTELPSQPNFFTGATNKGFFDDL